MRKRMLDSHLKYPFMHKVKKIKTQTREQIKNDKKSKIEMIQKSNSNR